MQASIVNRVNHQGLSVCLEKAFQAFKHQAQLRGKRPSVRFTSELLPAHYQSEVTQVSVENGESYLLKTPLPALLGNKGTLPRSMFKEALHAKFDLGDSAAIDFFDSFNNRYFRLYCQAVQKHELTSQLEEESFRWNQPHLGLTQMLACLAGLDTEESSLPGQHLIQYCGLLAMKSTSSHALKAILEDYFKLDFLIEGSEVEYQPLTACSLTQIGKNGKNHQLGIDALVGKTTPMLGQKLKIKICPKDFQQYLSIGSDPNYISAINQVVRSYMGVGVKYALYMEVHKRYLPHVTLSSSPGPASMLGQTAWMGRRTTFSDSVEVPLSRYE
ncbi:type VI secretion system baseplate subunit TssG [Vibrio sp. S4M6]|uniref:type VI secretion system baseplate subunit TssG n=1 Tax=Vibrio sinus TaxID=2946865 RepID=UPI00202A3CA9|nr:type VI secretion system baseplate subunit TssG [Vibrio sinus]MCL9781228.1 type VI secretion system baseplate subunit TssG [Vibrio sinus]